MDKQIMMVLYMIGEFMVFSNFMVFDGNKGFIVSSGIIKETVLVSCFS
jgi:hypothetical protein